MQRAKDGRGALRGRSVLTSPVHAHLAHHIRTTLWQRVRLCLLLRQNSVRLATTFRPIPGTFNAVSRCKPRIGTWGRPVDSRRARYLAAAEDCIRLAGQIVDPARKLVMIDLASTWMRLARQAAKNERADVVYGLPIAHARTMENSTSH